MIKKLLLVRKANSKSTLLEEAGVAAFAKGKPLQVSPLKWREEDGISHFGYVLNDVKLKELTSLNDYIAANEGLTAVDLIDNNVDKTLENYGLRQNKAAE